MATTSSDLSGHPINSSTVKLSKSCDETKGSGAAEGNITNPPSDMLSNKEETVTHSVNLSKSCDETKGSGASEGNIASPPGDMLLNMIETVKQSVKLSESREETRGPRAAEGNIISQQRDMLFNNEETVRHSDTQPKDGDASTQEFISSQLSQRDQKKPSTKSEKQREISTETPRSFLAESHPEGYTIGNKFLREESSPCYDNLLKPIREYKRFYGKDIKSEKRQKEKKGAVFLKRVKPFISCCLNTRCNGTIYLGVDNDRTILGVELKDGEKDDLKRTLSGAWDGQIYSEDMVSCRECVSVVFVPIIGQENKYVIEVDIEPKFEVCGEAAFALKNESDSCDYYERVPPDQTEKIKFTCLKKFFERVKRNAKRREQQERRPQTYQCSQDFIKLMRWEPKGKSKPKYVVISNPKISDKEKISFISELPVSAVFDLGRLTDNDKYKTCFNRVKVYTALNEIKNDLTTQKNENTDDTIVPCVYLGVIDSEWNDWSIDNLEMFHHVVEKLCKCKKNVCFLFLITSSDIECHLNIYREIIIQLETTETPIVCLCDGQEVHELWKQNLTKVTGEKHYSSNVSKSMSIPFENIPRVIAATDPSPGSFIMPTSYGLIRVDEDMTAKFPHLDILPANYKDEAPEGRAKLDSYHCESKVTWENFYWTDCGQNHVLIRNEDCKLDKLVNDALRDEKAPVSVVTIYHQPGAGGTTAAKRCMWGQHQNFRVCCVKEITADTPLQLSKLWEYDEPNCLYRQPIVVMVEDDVVGGQISDLVDQLKKHFRCDKQVVCVILHVVRCKEFCLPSNVMSQKYVFIQQHLIEEEFERFRCRLKDERKHGRKLSPNEVNPKTVVSFATSYVDHCSPCSVKVFSFLCKVIEREYKTCVELIAILQKHLDQFRGIPLRPLDKLFGSSSVSKAEEFLHLVIDIDNYERENVYFLANSKFAAAIVNDSKVEGHCLMMLLQNNLLQRPELQENCASLFCKRVGMGDTWRDLRVHAQAFVCKDNIPVSKEEYFKTVDESLSYACEKLEDPKIDFARCTLYALKDDYSSTLELVREVEEKCTGDKKSEMFGTQMLIYSAVYLKLQPKNESDQKVVISLGKEMLAKCKAFPMQSLSDTKSEFLVAGIMTDMVIVVDRFTKQFQEVSEKDRNIPNVTEDLKSLRSNLKWTFMSTLEKLKSREHDEMELKHLKFLQDFKKVFDKSSEPK